MTHHTDGTSEGRPRHYIPDGEVKKDLDQSAALSGFMAVASVISVFAAYVLQFHPLSRGWGYMYGVAFVIGMLGALRRETYTDQQGAYRSSNASWIATLVSLLFVVVGWFALIITDAMA